MLGLYDSGSSALAGMLDRLGVNMAPPFWGEFYEPYELSWHLRKWWDEPRLKECAPPEHRVRFLRRWIELHECSGSAGVGAKHPLLSLCGKDLVAAWGKDARFVWSYRPLEESIRGLKRRSWMPGHEERVQRRLWEALHELERSNVPMLKLDWGQVKADPAFGVRELARVAEIDPTAAQLSSVANIIRRGAGSRRRAKDLGRRLYCVFKARLSASGGSGLRSPD
ncbi:MAG TPA: hypothetical protein VMD49_00020 [Steroidobacteraceae bacterium]|nr:hypothetical protein [Steroidobacteraceae bacterium]